MPRNGNVTGDFITDDKGKKKGVIIGLKKYRELMELIENLEDTRDLLKAELEACSFTPYDEFRKTWL
ncbi:MAG: hypothetical protein PHW04_15725 [Candidatus Wallbacteria bacterium]|nr:hypothetical protein [Candidatus Wallbacteria bacterium]